jgi:hypothetical protein
MREGIPPLPQYAFMAWCFVKYRDKFTFTFYLYILKWKILIRGIGCELSNETVHIISNTLSSKK